MLGRQLANGGVGVGRGDVTGEELTAMAPVTPWRSTMVGWAT